MTTTTFNTKISEVKNKIPVVRNLAKKTDYDAETLEIEGKFITASVYNKFETDILDVKIKKGIGQEIWCFKYRKKFWLKLKNLKH